MADTAKTAARKAHAATTSTGGIASKDWLLSDSFIKRSLSIWLHNAVASFLIWLIVMAIFLLIAVTFAGGIIGLMSEHNGNRYDDEVYQRRDTNDFDRFDDMDLPPPPGDVMLP